MGRLNSFVFVTALLLLTRFGDLYTTYLVTPDLAEETNILVTRLGFGWTDFIISNILLTGIILSGNYYYYFQYRPAKIAGADNIKNYLSMAYFGDKGKFSHLFYKLPTHNQYMQIGHVGYAFPRAVIAMSLLLMTNNLLNLQDGQYSSLLRTYSYASLIKPVVYLSPFIFFLWYGVRREYRSQAHLTV
ncbi:hypothetical protein SAMN06269250_5894 [Spirosoma fluviale]|uniref:Uncharacterized protein n=1 Tax=Spirosoma fluviale TaxID=1597977 RepID=A0A286GRM9_9BACT|nr:hypothetical protein SAMN06269250_5894 [Spirosoma fluviale]